MTLTGICVVKRTDAGIVGSVVNEFGLHAFDMVEKGRKLKVKNVMSMMDKWYIRKLLQNDLHILTSSGNINIGKKHILDASTSTIRLENVKYNIEYHFERIRQDDTTE